MRQDDRTVYRAKDAVRGDRTAYRAQDADREDRPGTKTTVYILAVLVLILLISAGFTGMWLVGNRGDKDSVNAKTESTAESATQDDETADPASDSASGNTKAGGIRLTEPNTSMN